MRAPCRIFILTAALFAARIAAAGSGSPSGPIVIDSMTFVPGIAVVNTGAGVYSDTLPPVASTTTAAVRITPYRAEHVNLRDNTGAALGVSGNPLYTTTVTSITVGAVTITNSSFSVTGSTVSIQGTVPVSGTFWPVTQPVSIAATVPIIATNVSTVTFNGSAQPVTAAQTGTWNVNATAVGLSTVTFNGTAQPVTAAQTTPANLKASVFIDGSSNTVSAAQSGSWSVSASQAGVWGTTATVVNVATVTFNGSAQPVTAAQSSPANLRVSASIDGSSNTVNTNILNVATVTISGTPSVSVSNYPAVQPVSGNGTFSVAPVAGIALPVLSTQTLSVSVANSPSVVVTASSFSVTGSTVSIQSASTIPVALQNVSTVTFSSTPSVNSVQSGAYRVDVSSISGVAQSTGNVVDPINNAWRVNVVAGAAGGGSAQLQVRDIAQTNTYVGWYTGASSVPVVEIGTPSIKYAEPTSNSLSVSSVSFSSTGDNIIVSTQTSQTVRVFRIMLVSSAATTIEFKSGGSTPLTGFMTLNTGGSVILDFSPEPWFVTGSGKAFIINQTGTAQISGMVQYTQS